MKYQPIEPLSAEIVESKELRALETIWKAQRHSLEEKGLIDDFTERLKREWAIETGIIERLYTWDRGVTETLIEQGIEAELLTHHAGLSERKAINTVRMIASHKDVLETLFSFVTGEQPLTEMYIRQIHAAFTEHQDSTEAQTMDGALIEIPLLKGVYKERPNNPKRQDGSIHEYCDPIFVKDEMERLLRWYDNYVDQKVAPEVLASWIHHRFTQIHPFQDGNGRVARALATLVFLKVGLFPLVVRDKEARNIYIPALEAADKGDMQPLVDFFSKRQSEAILQAMSVERKTVKTSERALIANVFEALQQRKEARAEEYQKVFSVAEKLQSMSNFRFEKLSEELRANLTSVQLDDENFTADFDFAYDNDSNSDWHHHQIVATAKKLGYFAQFGTYRAWTRLKVQTNDQFDILISFHGIGFEFRGVLVASICTFGRIRDEGGNRYFDEAEPANPEVFQFNWLEDSDSTEQRFEGWLDESMIVALQRWSRFVSSRT